jgi:hypothetical protein
MQAMDAASVSILLDERLEACVEPRDQDVVAGVLGDIFSDLPAVVMACHYDALLKENGFAFVEELRDLTRKDLNDMGMPLGHSKMILRVLIPSGRGQVLVTSGSVHNQSDVAAGPATFNIKAKAIPPLDANGFPMSRGWTAYEPVFTAALTLSPMPTERVVLVSKAFLRPTDAVPGNSQRVDGDHLDAIIWSALATAGTDGMPEVLLLAIPHEIRAGRFGLRAIKWIGSAVLTSSDDSVGILQDSYTNCVPVTRKAMLGAGLIHLAAMEQQLAAANCPQSDHGLGMRCLHKAGSQQAHIKGSRGGSSSGGSRGKQYSGVSSKSSCCLHKGGQQVLVAGLTAESSGTLCCCLWRI